MARFSSENSEIDISEAQEIINGPFGVELRNMVSASTAIFLLISKENGVKKLNNGTIFFLDTGSKKIGVTAYHVYEKYKDLVTKYPATTCQISEMLFSPERCVIDFSPDLDIVTFNINEDEVKKINKRFFFGDQVSWPPLPPEQGKGMVIVGYPGDERIEEDEKKLVCGIFTGFCVAESINERNITVQFREEDSVKCPAHGRPIILPGYDLGGISGAPLITLVQGKEGIWSWRFGGVITQQNNCGLLLAVRADYILPDGKLLKT